TLPVPIGLDRQCKRYAYRVIQMLPDHPVRQRTPASFPSTLQTVITPSPSTSSSESESSSTSRPRPSRINYAFHPQQEPYGNVNPEWRISHSQQAKFPTQLIRVLNTLSNYLPDGQQLEQYHPLIQPRKRLRCLWNHSERKNHTKFFAQPPPHWST